MPTQLRSTLSSRLGVLTLACFVLAALSPSVHGSDPPDVLVIAIDDLNDWVGVLGGHPQARTPRIDELAERGMSFTNAHAPATLCNASRTALLTGLRPSSSGVYENNADWRRLEVFQNISTLPRFFRDRGYETIGAGKIFHAHTFYPEGFSGYNDPDAWSSFFPSTDRQLPDEAAPSDRPANRNPFTNNFDWYALTETADQMGDTRVATWISDQLARTNSQPRFVAAGIYRPHLPWYTPRENFDAYPLDTIELPETLANDLDDVPEIATLPFLEITAEPPMALHRWIVAEDQWRRGVQAYLASVSYADAEVGRILDALDASGRSNETIIVLFSDHGFHLGEKQRWRKQTLWEESTRVPLIFVVPGITAPDSRASQPVSLMDIYPTLAELAGLPIPEHVEGKSLLPLLQDPAVSWDSAAITTSGFRNHSVRTGRYRYTRYSDRSEELYDLDADPHEWNNLIGEAGASSVRDALAAWLPTSNAPPH